MHSYVNVLRKSMAKQPQPADRAFPRAWMCPCACVHVKINKFVSLQKCSFNLLSDDDHDENNDNTRQVVDSDLAPRQGQTASELPAPRKKKKNNKHSFPTLKRPTATNKDTSRSLEKTRNSASEKVRLRPGSCPAEAEQRWKVATEAEKWLNYKLSTPAGHPRWHRDEGPVRLGSVREWV